MGRISVLNRVLLSLLGIFLVVLSFPHHSPSDMTNLSRDVVNSTLVFSFTPPFCSFPIVLSTFHVLFCLLIFALLAVVIVPWDTANRAWQSLRSHPKAFFAGIVSVELFFLSMIPSEPYFITSGPTVVLYLLVSSFGLFFFILGALPLLRQVFDHRTISELLDTFYDYLRTILFESPSAIFLGTLVLLELLLASLISYFVFEQVPHIQDSIAQVFHAKIFAEGYLTAPSPPLKEFYDYTHIINDGQWYSQYPPGHSVFLAFGVLIGAGWIVNPMLGALTIAVMYFLGKELYGKITGRLSAILAFLSPFVLFMSSEFMNHASSLFLFGVFLLFFVKALRSGKFIHGAIAGAAIGWLGCIRPYTAVALAAPVLLYGLVDSLKRFREVGKTILGFTMLVFVFIGLLLWFNYQTNGDPLMFGYEKLWGSGTNPGFGDNPWGGTHTPMKGFHQTISNLNGINKYLFEWPVPSLIFVVLFFLSGKANRWDILLIAVFASVNGFYFFYWFQDWCFGPRFLYESSVGLILLTARGIELLPSLWRDILGFQSSYRRIRIISVVLLIFFFLYGFVTNIPPHLENYGNAYWGVNAEVLNEVKARNIQKAVIFVRSNYGKGFIGNDPFLRQTVLYVLDRRGGNAAMMELYPDYDYYLAVGGTLTPIAKGQQD